MRRSTVFESARTRSSRCGRCRQAALAGSVGELSSAFDAEHRHSLPRGNQIEMRAEKRGIWATAAVCLGFGIASLGVCAAKESSLATEIEHDLAQGCTAAEHIPQIRERCEKAFKRLQKDVARQYDVKSFSTLAWGMPSCPVEKKYQHSNGELRCNDVDAAIRLYPRKPLILYMVDDAMNWQHFSTEAVLSCSSSCLFVGKVSPTAVPDALVFDCLQDPRRMSTALSSLEGQGAVKPPWIFLCMESAANVVRMQDESFLRQFDIVATYQRRSTVPLLYAPGNLSLYRYSLDAPTPKEGLLVWVASNCAPGRLEFVSHVMEMLRVDSYGTCLNNRQFPQDQPHAFASAKIPLFARYKFALSLENSMAEDYVTEKFYQPLIAGSVPIYMGAPNVQEFAPALNAFIDLRRFETVEALAEYVLYLDRNDTAYEELRSWRSRPLPQHFREQAKLGFNQGSHYGEMDMRQDPCRICKEASKRVAQRA